MLEIKILNIPDLAKKIAGQDVTWDVILFVLMNYVEHLSNKASLLDFCVRYFFHGHNREYFYSRSLSISSKNHPNYSRIYFAKNTSHTQSLTIAYIYTRTSYHATSHATPSTQYCPHNIHIPHCILSFTVPPGL